MGTYDSDQMKVRALIPDITKHDWDKTGTPTYILEDDLIDAYLEMHEGNIWRAAAEAISVLASNAVLVSKKIKSQDLSTDGPAEADALRKRAYELFQRADRMDLKSAQDDLFEIVPLVPTRISFGAEYI